MSSFVDDLVAALLGLHGAELLVVTGAGISRASGISTFRGNEPDAIWRTTDVALATRACLQRDPVGQWSWYLERFAAARQARPNPAHFALVELAHLLAERQTRLQLVTQNIDTLHEQAGTTELIKVHGTADRIRCSRSSCRFGAPRGSLPFDAALFNPFMAAPDLENLPRCPECGSILRAHVLFFDEYYLEHLDYRFLEAESLAQTAAMMLFIGTSFSVGVTDLYLRAARLRRVPAWSIDPFASAAAPTGLNLLPLPAEELLPACCEELKRRFQSSR